MKINKQLAQWMGKTLSMLTDGGEWWNTNGDSIWKKTNDQTIVFIAGDKTNINNIQAAAHIRAAGFTLIGI